MYKGKSILGLIPARGGSKGLPRKNILPLLGKPLVAWTIEEAKKSRYIDRLILSSEDSEIIATARQWGCEAPFVRPAELAGDDTPGIDPVLHALQAIPESYDYVVLLQVTSPLRTAEDIDRCLEYCINKNAPVCIAVTEPEKSPYWMYRLDEGNRLIPLMDEGYTSLRRQDLPTTYVINGAVYVVGTGWVKQHRTFLTPETLAYVMPRERSIDVDSGQDIIICELLLSRRRETCS
jgi:N-acylneuraminate cytidylyltransferase